MAEALHRRGLQVRVVERSEQPMNTLDPDMGALVADAIRGLGIELHLGVSVEGFDTSADGRVNAVQTSDGVFRADLVVLGLGCGRRRSSPRKQGSTWARPAGS